MDSLRIFVSSTFEELSCYRAAVTRAIISAGDIPEDMLYWPAAEERPLDESLRRVRGADLVILLIGHAYGHIPHGSRKSITELEFDEALARGIPIVPFRVSPDYPWLPKWIESDPDRARLLNAFLDKASQRLTFKSYSSAESLELLVTQAVVAFRARRTSVPTQNHRIQLVAVHASERLEYMPNCNIRVCSAPDGIPLLLRVDRSPEYGQYVRGLSAEVGVSDDSPVFLRIKEDLAQTAKAVALSRQVRKIEVDGEIVDCLVSVNTMSDLFAPSLLEGLLVSGGRSCRHSRQPRNREISSTPASRLTGLESEQGADARVESVGGANRFLCVPLDSEVQPFSGGWSCQNNERVFRKWRKFIEESIESFDTVEYGIRDQRQPYRGQVLLSATAEQFHEKWTEILSSEYEGRETLVSEILIPRASVLRFVLTIVDEVAEMHAAGRIHGDIKPSNILATRGGIRLIDHVELVPGERSPLVTVGWSPPEQICRRPVSFAADVYALGILLVRLLGGQQLGRLLQFRLPDGVDATAVEDPAVFVEPDSVVLRQSNRKSWLTVAERALRTDPNERFHSARELGEGIRDAMDGGPLGGHLCASFPWGSQPIVATQTTGAPYIAWMLSQP